MGIATKGQAFFGAFALFRYGFRPFFLGAALQAVTALPVWLLALTMPQAVTFAMPAMQWHIHEMLFGFAGAAIAGFLLTATPNWTGERGYAGRSLQMLFALWLAARLALNPWVGAPLWVGFALDVAFMPALIGMILPSLIRSKNYRHLTVVALLGLYGLADALCWASWWGWGDGLWDRGVTLGFDIVLLLVVIIGGRVIPSFTLNFLRQRGGTEGLVARPWLEITALGLTMLLLVVDQMRVASGYIAVIAAQGAWAHGARLAGWRGWRTLEDPLLWMLHVAYAWIPVALGLQAVFLVTGAVEASAWRHAYSVGVFACMILAIMSRAALAHTGRALVLPKGMAFAFFALIVAGVLRVSAPMFGAFYQPLLAGAGVLWVVAFGIYLGAYAGILIRPRPDGRAG